MTASLSLTFQNAKLLNLSRMAKKVIHFLGFFTFFIVVV
jgi:hypothetical protein